MEIVEKRSMMWADLHHLCLIWVLTGFDLHHLCLIWVLTGFDLHHLCPIWVLVGFNLQLFTSLVSDLGFGWV